ncbi:DUF86 domain-containing protein [Limnothrix sp. FACHB-881]|uniref:HepT-like ribonuclease domain-containing protein n=1 Tax=Limnothrix sp. FACHB-881 TaxID=2692819 RepID=UPI001688BD58|nr:DUF86 domain-containing protein [Limnothrix sp. FACHB-881]
MPLWLDSGGHCLPYSLAEVTRRVSEITRQSLLNISWQEINRICNRLVHDYDGVSFYIIWNIV